jgi:thiol-disulfide isomerase/thioredoxin
MFRGHGILRHSTLFILMTSWMGIGCRMQEGESTPSDPNPTPAPATNEHVLTIHPPAEGEVAPIVHGEYEKASASGRQLVVYLGATWCEPCQRFHHAVEHGDLDTKFPKLTLLEFDADKDQERLRVAGYSSRYIPLFALPKADGMASGKQVEGGIKGDGAVSYVSDKLKGLLAKN